MEVSDQLQAPAGLPQGKSPWNPLDRRLGGPQSRSGRGGEEKNSQPVAQRYTTELSRLLRSYGKWAKTWNFKGHMNEWGTCMEGDGRWEREQQTEEERIAYGSCSSEQMNTKFLLT
jgi:hypothetical protein